MRIAPACDPVVREVRINFPFWLTFTQYPYPGSTVLLGVYDPRYPKNRDVTIPPGIDDTCVVAIDCESDPTRFHPTTTLIVSEFSGVPRNPIVALSLSFSQYPEPGTSVSRTLYPVAGS